MRLGSTTNTKTKVYPRNQTYNPSSRETRVSNPTVGTTLELRLHPRCGNLLSLIITTDISLLVTNMTYYLMKINDQ